jgi:hypothetical protein
MGGSGRGDKGGAEYRWHLGSENRGRVILDLTEVTDYALGVTVTCTDINTALSCLVRPEVAAVKGRSCSQSTCLARRPPHSCAAKGEDGEERGGEEERAGSEPRRGENPGAVRGKKGFNGDDRGYEGRTRRSGELDDFCFEWQVGQVGT